MRKSIELREEIESGKSKIEAIVNKAESENRDLSKDEAAIVDEWLGSGGKPGRIDALHAELDRATKLESEQRVKVRETLGPALQAQLRDSGIIRPSDGPVMFRDMRSGKAIRAFGKGETIASSVRDVCPDGIGQLVQASLTGLKSWHHPAVHASMSTLSNPAGGYLIGPQISSTVIDYARNRAALMQAGAMAVTMESPELLIATVNSDPEIQVKAEMEKFTGSTVTFGQVKMEAKTIGTVVTMSRELAEDAANVSAIVTQVLGRSLATAIDKMAIQGTGAGNSFNGMTVRTDIDNTGTTSVGAIAWEDFHNAATAVRERNYEPNGAVMNPTIYGDLQIIKGTDSWFGAPPSLDGVGLFQTNNCPLAFGIVGDFSHAVFGIRSQALIEISVDADEAFERHQVKVKITFRGDFGLTDPNAFHRLEGITS